MKAIDRDLFESWWIPEPNTGCWLWTKALGNFGYGNISIRCGTRIAHRMSWRIYRGEIPKGMCVLHQCDVPSCVNPNHLFLGSRIDNNLDRDNKGRTIAGYSVCALGERHPLHKLTKESVLLIRDDPRTQREIAKDYGVCQMTICDIKRKKKWRWL